MTSRDKILAQVEANLPAPASLPSITIKKSEHDLLAELKGWLNTLHVDVQEINGLEEVTDKISINGRVVTSIKEIALGEYINQYTIDPHELENVELAILPGHFAVAENGAIWMTEDQMGHRVLPFIAQQLAVVISKNAIVANMHEAYERIGNADHGFAAFIAGPSKTADIEQSLVLGAHGPKSMTVFILN